MAYTSPPMAPPPLNQPAPQMAPTMAPSGGSNGMAITSMILGIVGLCLSTLFVCQVLAIIFGVIGLNKAKADPQQKGKGMAIAGLVMGIVGIVLGILYLTVLAAEVSRILKDAGAK